jgi:hypothetical protein
LNRVCCFYPFFKIAKKMYNPKTIIYDIYDIIQHSQHSQIIKVLLSDPRVDPSDENNYAIRLASYYGYLKIVKLLLSDPRVDPSDENN